MAKNAMAKSARAKSARAERLQPIHPNVLYPLSIFEEHVGLSKSAMRSARRQGRRVLRVSGRGFVLGSDFIEHLIKVNEKPQDD